MQHSFDIEIAKKYGILEAILMQNIYFWINKNQANEMHLHDGKYWTYNSRKAFSLMFPYASEKQIRRALEKLENSNILVKGNFNKIGFDRTLWYSFSDYGFAIMQKSQIDLTKWANGNDQTGKPIPDIKPNNNTSLKVSMKIYEEIVGYMNTVNEHRNFTIKIPFCFKATSKDTQKYINARLKDGYNIEEFKDVIYWGYFKFVENEFKTETEGTSVKYFRPSTLFSDKHFGEYLNEYKARTAK